MIQKTVTSSPTPGYVSRVVAVFKDNGHGVRGDLAAVTRAILLDPEARGARKIDREYGRLREPALFWTGMIRALDIATDGQPLSDWAVKAASRCSGRRPCSATTRRTTRSPAAAFPRRSSASSGPPSSSTARTRSTVCSITICTPAPEPFWGTAAYVPNAIGTSSPDAGGVRLPTPRTRTRSSIALNRLFLHGAMTPTTRQDDRQCREQARAGDVRARAQLAVNLVLISVDYQIQR